MNKIRILIFSFIVSLFTFALHGLNDTVPSEKHIVIVVPSYNNSLWYQLNISSIIKQRYNNYSVLYMDDCSTDGTPDLVEKFIQNYQSLLELLDSKYDHIRIVKNRVRRGALANIYNVAHSCPDDSIVLVLDGDDWFKDSNVLSRINKAYQDPNVWLTYGQYEAYPTGVLGISQEVPPSVIASNSFRDHQWVTSHLRTFYAGLFKHIQKEDLYYNDHFFNTTGDQAVMFPLLELAGHHSKFIPEVLYVYNSCNLLSDHMIHNSEQAALSKVIRGRERYKPLSILLFSKE